jgi:hypothetical protein
VKVTETEVTKDPSGDVESSSVEADLPLPEEPPADAMLPEDEPVEEEESEGEGGEPSLSDQFRSRVAADYPDLDVTDDEAYFANANARYDELKNLRDGVSKFRDALDLDADKAGLFNEMIVEASENPQFDPVVFLVEHGVDINEALTDPEYSKKIAEAREKYLNEVAQGEELSAQFEENAPASMEAINQYCEENGISDDEKNEIIGKMYDIMDNLIVGNMPVDLFEFVKNGVTHDADVEEANLAGKAEGKSTKVNQKLRKLKNNDRVGGRQASVPESMPGGEEEANMFGL